MPQVTEATALAPGGLVNALAVRQPVGVVTCITSYNNPLANTAGKIAPALAMGNAVLVKPAPQDPLAVFVLGEVLTDAGLPPAHATSCRARASRSDRRWSTPPR